MTQNSKEKDNEIIQGEIESRGGYRPGAGRPRGSKNKLTKSVKRKEKSVKERVLNNLDKLINAQLSLAKGQQFLYEIKMRNVGGKRKPQHTLVTDPKKIKKYMDGDADEDQYFYVTTKEPENKAIESLLDRAFGKATTNQNTEHNFNVNVLQYDQITAEHRELLNEANNDSVQLPTKELSDGDDGLAKKIQNSSVAQTVRED